MGGGTARGTWILPTGETVTAKVDEDGVESVYVGARLVSRAPRGRMLTGHPVKGRGPAEGTYRGGRDARVLFEEAGARLVIDGETQPERVADPSSADATRPPNGTLGFATFFIFLLVFAVATALIFRRQAHRATSVATPTSRTVAGAATTPPAPSSQPDLPLTESHRSPYAPLVIHYPKDFDISWDRKAGGTNGAIHLERRGRYGVIEIFADTKPDTFDLWRLDGLLHEAMSRSWASRQVVVESVDRSDGTCHGERAAIAVRQLKVQGSPIREWSCTFVHHDHAYHFLTYVPNRLVADEPYLRSIVEATDLD